MIKIIALEYNPGYLISCDDRADANDIADSLTLSSFEFTRIGYTGVWIIDLRALEYIADDYPGLELPDPPT